MELPTPDREEVLRKSKWPAHKFGMGCMDAYTTLHGEYNTITIALEDRHYFVQALIQSSETAETEPEFRRLLGQHRHTTLDRLTKELERYSRQHIANESLMSEWSSVLRLLVNKSFESLVCLLGDLVNPTSLRPPTRLSLNGNDNGNDAAVVPNTQPPTVPPIRRPKRGREPANEPADEPVEQPSKRLRTYKSREEDMGRPLARGRRRSARANVGAKTASRAPNSSTPLPVATEGRRLRSRTIPAPTVNGALKS